MIKNLTKKEFIDRSQEVLKARKIFIDSGITKNITIAWELYLKVVADTEMQEKLSSFMRNKPVYPLDEYERPKCPDCSFDMMFRTVPENEEGIKIQLICSNQKCDTVISDTNDISWWMKNLQIKEKNKE